MLLNILANILTTSPEKTPSPNNLVRKYLRSIERSRPLARVIDESRDGYGKSMSSGSYYSTEAEPKSGLPVKPRGIRRRKKNEAKAAQSLSIAPEK